MEIKFKDVRIGQTFIWYGHEFTKLDDNLSIINPKNENKDIYFCCFDNVDNNYKMSLIRHFINNRYLGLLGLDTSCLKFNRGYCKLLSIEEYKKYKNLIKPCGRWWWLRSPHSDNSDNACCVDYYGYCGYNSVRDHDCAARAAFNLKSDTLVLI